MTALSPDAATKVVDRIPRPGMHAQLEAAIRDLCKATVQFPGHLGVTVLRPSPPSQPGFRIIYKFATSAHMQAWDDSVVQQHLLAKANLYTQGEPRYHRLTGLEAWFSGQSPVDALPSCVKMTVVSWIGIFPLVYLYSLVVNTLAQVETPSVARVFVVTVLAVPTMSYVVAPLLTRVFKHWLFRS